MTNKTLFFDGERVVVTEQGPTAAEITRWSMTPDQADKQLDTFQSSNVKLSNGDVTAIKDAKADADRKAARDARNK